ncbi:MAG: hypothetical protein KDD56_02555 [Bdellovibrionales bacterium]|nr:hypothetical protein [Bdellovibrionales bacterium]
MQEVHNPYHAAIETLNLAGADYVIVGGFSLIMHGSNRFTPDINVAVSLENDNPIKFVSAIIDAGLEPPVGVNTSLYADPEIRSKWFNEKSMRFLIFTDKELPTFSIQLFNEYPQPMSFPELLADSVEIDIAGHKTKICSKQHLIAMKKIAWRNQDRDDVEVLTLIDSLGDKIFSKDEIDKLVAIEEGSFARERLLSLYDFNQMTHSEKANWLKNMLTALGGFCIL